MARSPGGPPARPSPLFEKFDTIPELAAVRDAVAAGRWSAVEAALSEFDAEDAVGVLDELAKAQHVERLLESAVAENPRSPVARTALARRYVQVGWDLRARPATQHAAQAQLDAFRHWLNRAERLLVEVCAEHPAYAPAWAVRQHTARGLELGASESRRRWVRLQAVGGPLWLPAMQLLLTLGPRWFGSAEVARDFVNETVATAPEGALTWALVPALHVEQWSQGDATEQKWYFRAAAVADELRDAALRSVLHPAFRGGLLAPAAHNLFAMAFWLGEHHAEAAHHLRAANGRLTEAPWSYLNEPETVARACRAFASGRSGGTA